MDKQNKIKYDEKYISYVKNGDSAAVFIIRDIVRNINTSGMWIDVINKSGDNNKYGKWDFKSITIELFPRKIKPIYPKGVSDEYKKYITWKTATEDIEKQKQQGYRGKKFMVHLELVNKNQGKMKIIEKKIWHKKFGKYVHESWEGNPDCEVHGKKVPIEPAWEYKILSIKKL